MGEKISLALHQEVKHTCGKEQYIEWCTGTESNGIAWMKAEMWKSRGLKRRTAKVAALFFRK
jgi:hypothetical protein